MFGGFSFIPRFVCDVDGVGAQRTIRGQEELLIDIYILHSVYIIIDVPYRRVITLIRYMFEVAAGGRCNLFIVFGIVAIRPH